MGWTGRQISAWGATDLPVRQTSSARSRDPLAPRKGDSNRLQLAIGEPHHLQQQPAVAKPRDLGLAEGARLVVDRRLDDLEVLLGRAEEQVEIAEGIEIAEITALPRQHFVVLAQQYLGAAQR